jgi:hypothetical protein
LPLIEAAEKKSGRSFYFIPDIVKIHAIINPEKILFAQ